jgi:hypothetical protein
MRTDMSTEEPKRKAHTKEVLRELFAKSGNMCAWPGCSQIMITAEGKFVGQICHIEGVKGERFRDGMSNDERAAVSNLMLLCYPHHIETNDEVAFTVERLKKMKREHEALFTDPGTAIYNAYVDRSARRPLNRATTAKRFSDVLGWPSEPVHLAETTDEINAIFEKVEKLDMQSRLFIVAVARRAWRVRNTANVNTRNGHLLLRWDDFTEATGSSDDEVKRRIEALEAHHLGSYDEDTMEVAGRPVYAIMLYRGPASQADYWLPIVEFCEKAGESLEEIVLNLDVSRLD